jgi:gluconolactonase
MSTSSIKNNPLDGFIVDRQAISYVGADLQRPECILAESDGVLWTADLRGVMRISAGGAQQLLPIGGDGSAVPSAPNGMAFDADGSILIANIGANRLERLTRDGQFSVLAEEIEGRPIGKINFVLRDSRGRLWITVSTRREQWIEAISPNVADGYIAMFDRSRWRIVADGFAFTNEARFDAKEEWLYVVETCGPRIVRLRVAEDGSLGKRQTFGPDRHDGLIDGIAFDDYGNLWGTHVFRDRLFAITPEGELRDLLDDCGDRAAHERLIQAFNKGDTITAEMLTACQGRIAPGMTSIAFGGADNRTVYIGSLDGVRAPCFRSPVAGLALL